MQKVDKSVMDQELKKVSEQIPPLLFPHPEPRLPCPGKWNHPAKTKPGRGTLASPSTFIHIEKLGQLLKSCPLNSYFQ